MQLHRKKQTGTHAVAVQKNRASAANTMFAAYVSACKPEFAAQEVGHEETRLNLA